MIWLADQPHSSSEAGVLISSNLLEGWKEVVAYVTGYDVVVSLVGELVSRIRVCSSMLVTFDTGLAKGLVNEKLEGDVMAVCYTEQWLGIGWLCIADVGGRVGCVEL